MTATLDTNTHDQPASPAGDAMALVGAAIFAADPARLSSFYGMLLGVRFERKVHEDGRDHRIARIGGTHFEIKATTTPDGDRTPDAVAPELAGDVSTIELSFTVPDATASWDYALMLGAMAHEPVTHHTWGSFGTVRDPEGNRIGLFSLPQESTDIEEGR